MKRNRQHLHLSKFIALLAAILALIFSNYIVSQPTSAVSYSSANNFYFKDFTADYYLTKAEDGTSRMTVVEELTAVFPNSNQNHGITRIIPYTNNDGKNRTMPNGDTIYINVERNGHEEPVSKVEVGDGYFMVYIGDADEYVHGEQTYTLTYEFQNLILDFEDWQELYWDANGNDWQQRFDQVTARVHLDDDIIDHFTGETSCYVGRYGESGQSRCITTEIEDGVEFSAKRLLSRETLTFDMQFDANTFAPAPQQFSYKLIIGLVIALGISIGLIVLMVLSWKQVAEKRRYYKGLFVKPEYTPLPDYTVAEMAENYMGKGLLGNSKVATLLDLAVHHKVELVKTEKTGAFGKTKTQWMVRIKTDTLNKQQACILKILAGSDTPLRLNQEIYIKTHTATSELQKLNERFAKSVTSGLKKKDMKEAASSESSKKKPINWNNLLIGCTCATMILFCIGCGILFSDDTESYITVIGEDSPLIILSIVFIPLITIVASFIIYGKTHSYSTHTMKGLEVSRYMEGMRLYMTMAEADRLKILQSVKGADTSHEGVVKIYEKLLPYAALFKLEKSWLNEMSKYYELEDVSAPVWYFGIGAFSARDFNSAMSSISSSAANSISYSSSSGSSSGFSGGGGGGFSGGGGGGGGGGGW